MPKGVYERTEEQKARIAALAAAGAAASALHWRGRKRSPVQRAAHGALMRGRQAHNKGKKTPADVVAQQIVHGHASGGLLTPTYVSWRSMLQRCRDPRKGNYKYYGGRGITVCDRWWEFANFLADMGERPPRTELGRIDNDGDYEPGNVEWTSKAANIAERNRRMAKT